MDEVTIDYSSFHNNPREESSSELGILRNILPRATSINKTSKHSGETMMDDPLKLDDNSSDNNAKASACFNVEANTVLNYFTDTKETENPIFQCSGSADDSALLETFPHFMNPQNSTLNDKKESSSVSPSIRKSSRIAKKVNTNDQEVPSYDKSKDVLSILPNMLVPVSKNKKIVSIEQVMKLLDENYEDEVVFDWIISHIRTKCTAFSLKFAKQFRGLKELKSFIETQPDDLKERWWSTLCSSKYTTPRTLHGWSLIFGYYIPSICSEFSKADLPFLKEMPNLKKKSSKKANEVSNSALFCFEDISACPNPSNNMEIFPIKTEPLENHGVLRTYLNYDNARETYSKYDKAKELHKKKEKRNFLRKMIKKTRKKDFDDSSRNKCQKTKHMAVRQKRKASDNLLGFPNFKNEIVYSENLNKINPPTKRKCKTNCKNDSKMELKHFKIEGQNSSTMIVSSNFYEKESNGIENALFPNKKTIIHHSVSQIKKENDCLSKSHSFPLYHCSKGVYPAIQSKLENVDCSVGLKTTPSSFKKPVIITNEGRYTFPNFKSPNISKTSEPQVEIKPVDIDPLSLDQGSDAKALNSSVAGTSNKICHEKQALSTENLSLCDIEKYKPLNVLRAKLEKISTNLCDKRKISKCLDLIRCCRDQIDLISSYMEDFDSKINLYESEVKILRTDLIYNKVVLDSQLNEKEILEKKILELEKNMREKKEQILRVSVKNSKSVSIQTTEEFPLSKLGLDRKDAETNVNIVDDSNWIEKENILKADLLAAAEKIENLELQSKSDKMVISQLENNLKELEIKIDSVNGEKENGKVSGENEQANFSPIFNNEFENCAFDTMSINQLDEINMFETRTQKGNSPNNETEDTDTLQTNLNSKVSTSSITNKMQSSEQNDGSLEDELAKEKQLNEALGNKIQELVLEGDRLKGLLKQEHSEALRQVELQIAMYCATAERYRETVKRIEDENVI